jgi:HD superfamily phosphohydrolase
MASDIRTSQCSWNIDELMHQLEEKYVAHNSSEYWSNEKLRVRSRLDSLCTELSSRYIDPVVLGLGGSAVVIRISDCQLSGQACALKFPRPVPGKSNLLVSMMDKEIAYLAKLRHSSIVRIHGSSRLDESHSMRHEAQTDSSGEMRLFPYYVMDFIDGDSSERFFKEKRVSTEYFVHIVRATVDAVNYLHQNSVAHLDLKPDNILIGLDGTPVIADLGTAKTLTQTTGETIVACTYGYADPALVAVLDKDPSDENRAKGTISRSKIDPKWDLYSLGKTLLTWLGLDAGGAEASRLQNLETYERKYLLLMAGRLLHGEVPAWLEERIGLDRALLHQLSYESSERVLQDVRKLSGEYSIVDEVPELNAYHSKSLQVTRETPTTYTDRMERLLSHPALRRLASISQLGLVNQVYPTATHSRLEHSLGTFHNASRFVLSLYYDPLSPLFRQMVEASDVSTCLASALLHDVGQAPLSHDLEEIEPTLFNHKQLGVTVIRGFRDPKKPGAKRITLQKLDEVLKLWDTTPDRVIQILSARPDDDNAPLKDRLLHSIIDGPLDADKLDYLRRDSDRLGVPYGNGIDLERILRSLTVTLEKKGKTLVACIGVHEKGKVAAEFVAIARYAMFSQVYWQHSVRCMKAMLFRAVLPIVVQSGEKERTKNEFRSAFEHLVLSLPRSLYQGQPIQEALFAATDEEQSTVRMAVAPPDLGTTEGTISATDAVVLAFLRSWLANTGARETELLDDLLARRLYKRLFVFTKERSEPDWNAFIEHWERLSPSRKVAAYVEIEGKIAEAVGARMHSAPTTTTVTQKIADLIQHRAQARLPIILIDIPGSRPGADFPLYYVVEAQRRALRRDERAVGEVQPSEVWKNFGSRLRDSAGKIRVFCHADFIDAVSAAVARDEFLGILEKVAQANL